MYVLISCFCTQRMRLSRKAYFTIVKVYISFLAERLIAYKYEGKHYLRVEMWHCMNTSKFLIFFLAKGVKNLCVGYAKP